MTLSRLLPLLAAGAATVIATSSAPLRVIRTTPTGEAEPDAEISVSFDRPVAGSLERSVDPAKVLRITPAVAGKYEWRDPVTVRFRPARPFAPDTRVSVTVTTDFVAMDGEKLAEPETFTFRVRGPRLLAGHPVGEGQDYTQATPSQRFDVIYSSAVDAAKLASSAFVEVLAPCVPKRIDLRVAGQRAIADDDGWQYRSAGGYSRNSSRDSLRRVVSLLPRSPLPLGCQHALGVPNEISAASMDAGVQRWGFSTYGPLKVVGSDCYGGAGCPRGPLRIEFNNNVAGAEVLKRVSIVPAIAFTVRDSAAVQRSWSLEAKYAPRTRYTVVVDSLIRDVFGQRIGSTQRRVIATTGFEPYVNFPFGKQTVERVGFRTLPIEHANADTLIALIAPVPVRLEPQFLTRYAWGYGELWDSIAAQATTRRIPVRATRDRGALTGLVMPVPDATQVGTPTLYAVKVSGTGLKPDAKLSQAPLALVQVTDIGVTARIGTQEGYVWVTGVSDGRPRAGAEVLLYNAQGRPIASARSDAQGLATLREFAAPLATPATDEEEQPDEADGGYLAVRLGADRAIVAVNGYDPDLSSWTFGIPSAWGDERFPLAGAVFAERGIYRPGEEVYLKAIVRAGTLGSLRSPAAGDSMRWVVRDREGEQSLARTVTLSAFGTAEMKLPLAASAAVGTQSVSIEMKRRGRWRSVASTSFRVGEFRPPEFLIDVGMPPPPRVLGTEAQVQISARYLFGAPVGMAAVNWEARLDEVMPWDLTIPNTDGWMIGRNDWGWDESNGSELGNFASGVDTLDASGTRTIRVQVPQRQARGAARLVVAAAVTDVNRQSVGAITSAIVHPARFYVGAKLAGDSWFWRAGDAQRMSVRAIRPDGTDESGVRVTARLIRREWHRVRRERDGIAQMIGEWVTDTVTTCTVVTAATAPTCTLTPAGGGVHKVVLSATDSEGREATTTFSRWVTGTGFVPWSDESQFKMDLYADKDRYNVGDTATVLLAAPFTDAEAWLTVEREQVIEQRRLRITSGSQTIKIPITEAHAPNAYVSVVMVRGRSAKPGTLDDPGRPTMRVGYVQLKVTPEVKRLRVALALSKPEYRPGDTAQVSLAVHDSRGRGQRAEVALWAVDEGVLSLTAYKTPNVMDLIYQPRALGLRLASNLVSVTPQVAEGEKGRRAPGGGGGADGSEVLRSRFKTTAFYLGTVMTDSLGAATAKAKLPDNLTTFRVMAVAVTSADRFGHAELPLLVTRPVVARPALPRFVRPGDTLFAGTVINRRDGRAVPVQVKSQSQGIKSVGPTDLTVTLAAGKGAESRFKFVAQPGDSATFRFDVRSGTDLDAVRVSVPVKPDYQARTQTIAGALRDTATIEFSLPAGIDPARSRIAITVGPTPISIARGIERQLRLYPYGCTEQISSQLLPMLALLRADGAMSDADKARMRSDVAKGLAILIGRQRADGGIGYWGSGDWTSPWLSAYAGTAIAEARELGIPVDSAPLARLTEYLRTSLREAPAQNPAALRDWYDSRWTRFADQISSVDVLSRLGQADVPAENELLRAAGLLRREDRLRLAEVVARRGAMNEARQLVAPIEASVKVEGRLASLPPDSLRWYFHSETREYAQMLTTLLAVNPRSALIGPLVERLALDQQRPFGSTQGMAATVRALAIFSRTAASQAPRSVVVRSGRRVVAGTTGPMRDTSVAIAPLLGGKNDETRPLRLTFAATGVSELPSFYHVTVTEVPLTPPVRPVESGIRVERWYEKFSDGTPVTSVMEGELVRVRIRVTSTNARRFVVLDDPLPAGLEAIDLSLRTETTLGGTPRQLDRDPNEEADTDDGRLDANYGLGRWDSGWWTPWDFREIRDDRVVYSAAVLWAGTWNVSYVARATTPGSFLRLPAQAEEMYNPGVNGRSDGGRFVVTEKK
ncbi:MAG: Ig-like domain-containing protein [Gemmatimonadaceae bacterium]|nr:Ig-like domain-containing protein [Gemmatimonadaceae bacterium]